MIPIRKDEAVGNEAGGADGPLKVKLEELAAVGGDMTRVVGIDGMNEKEQQQLSATSEAEVESTMIRPVQPKLPPFVLEFIHYSWQLLSPLYHHQLQQDVIL